MMKIIVKLLLVLLLTSCNDEITYSLVVTNRSLEVIDEVNVWYDDKFVSNGMISPGNNITILSANFKS